MCGVTWFNRDQTMLCRRIEFISDLEGETGFGKAQKIRHEWDIKQDIEGEKPKLFRDEPAKGILMYQKLWCSRCMALVIAPWDTYFVFMILEILFM